MHIRIGVFAMLCMRLMKFACAIGPPWNMQMPPTLYFLTASCTSSVNRIGRLVLGSKDDPRITISWAIFSSALNVLKTLSTHAEALKRELRCATSDAADIKNATTNKIFRAIVNRFDIVFSVSEKYPIKFN
jgi:hypothetical protein